MIHSELIEDAAFFEQIQIRQRHIRMYNNVTLELVGGIVDRIVSTNSQEYMKYHNLIGLKDI